MKDCQSLNHTKWDCKYHGVFIPKPRKKKIYGAIRKHLSEIFQESGRQKEAKIVERHL
jgi:putative transposase